MKRMTCAALVAAALALAPAALQGADTHFVPLSGVLDAPGSYTLVGDRRSTANDRPAIQISADNVTLDLNGFTLAGPGGKQGVGIRIAGAKGVKVMNGVIANHAFGVMVTNSSNVMLTGLVIRGEGLPIASLPPETAIMLVQSRNVVIEHNAIYNTGLGIFVRGGMSGGNRIANNALTAGANGALGICYNPADTDPMGPRGDLVTGNLISGFGTGIQASPTSRANVFLGNTIFHTGSTAVELLNPDNTDKDNIKVMLP